MTTFSFTLSVKYLCSERTTRHGQFYVNLEKENFASMAFITTLDSSFFSILMEIMHEQSGLPRGKSYEKRNLIICF